MKQRNCINCGAPLEHSYNHKCKYCGTLYDFNEPKEKTIEFHSYDMVNVHFLKLERYPLTNDIIMYFDGIKLEEPTIYEYQDNRFVSKTINYVNPPKAFFAIQLNIKDLEEHGIHYLWSTIENYIRPTETEKVRHQIQERCWEFSKNGVNVWGLTHC